MRLEKNVQLTYKKRLIATIRISSQENFLSITLVIFVHQVGNSCRDTSVTEWKSTVEVHEAVAQVLLGLMGGDNLHFLMEKWQGPFEKKNKWYRRNFYGLLWKIQPDILYWVMNLFVWSQVFSVKYGFTNWNSLLFPLHKPCQCMAYDF